GKILEVEALQLVVAENHDGVRALGLELLAHCGKPGLNASVLLRVHLEGVFRHVRPDGAHLPHLHPALGSHVAEGGVGNHAHGNYFRHRRLLPYQWPRIIVLKPPANASHGATGTSTYAASAAIEKAAR